MVVHIKHSTGGNTQNGCREKGTSEETLIKLAKEMAKEMAREMVKEMIANMPAKQIVDIRNESGKVYKDELIAIDNSIADVTGEGGFTKNFESLGKEEVSDDSGEDKRKKLKDIINKK